MRFGFMRGAAVAALMILASAAQSALADGFVKTIPREVLAQDLNTGQPYFAPAIPWGCYAKDGPFDHFYPKGCGLCGLLHGHKGCCGSNCFGRACGGGSGLGHGGNGLGHGGSGLGKGCGLFGKGCAGGDGCGNGGSGKGCGLFGHGHGCGDPNGGLGCGSARRIKDCGFCKNKGCGLCQSSAIGAPLYVSASSQSPSPQAAPIVSPTAQVISPTGQIIDPATGFVGGPTSLCDSCTGKGCGKCGGCGLLHRKGFDPNSGGCGGAGCGKCGGKGCGLFAGHGNGGNGFGGHGNGEGCNNCGGKGCGLCSGLGGHMKGKLLGLLHHGKGGIKYFVGPGGPVPLTPGYVPYTITTRSPRDFLAFPPYTPSEF